MGYAGGTSPAPTYRNLGDHTETVRIVYDPSVIDYDDLLRAFWAGHRPTSPPWNRQYMSAIFFTSETQRQQALASKAEEEQRQETNLYTEILPAESFYPAEGYHQKHALRSYPKFMEEIKARYGSEEEFILSTPAARINGYLAGYGDCETVENMIDQLGLSRPAARHLLEIVCGTASRESCPLP